MKIQLTDGNHITATEKRSIAQLIEAGQTYGRNKPNTKTYDVIQGWQDSGKWCYKIKIGSFTTAWCETEPKWQYNTVTIKTDKP